MTSKSNQQQYLMEKQQRYLRFLMDEEGREEKVRTQVLRDLGKLPKEKKKVTRQKPSNQDSTYVSPNPIRNDALQTMPTAMTLTMDRYTPSQYRVHNVILDSSFRDVGAHPSANDFVVRLTEPFTHVAALRILRTEFYQPSNTTGYFVMNEVQIPLQLYNIESAYLFINGYTRTTIANETNTTFFGRIGPGTEIYPAVTGDITQDPFIYIMRPVEPRLRRFHIRLMQADGSPYPVNNARIIIHLAVYCTPPTA